MNSKAVVSGLGFAVVGGLATTSVQAIAGRFTGEKMLARDLLIIVTLVGMGVAVLLALFVSRRMESFVAKRVRPKVREELTPILEQDIWGKLQRQIGLERIYVGFPECETEILAQIESSRRVKVFLQIGKTVLSGATGIYDYLAKANLRPDVEVRVLHASAESPYLSERVASDRGSDINEWLVDLEHARRKIGSLMTKTGARLEGREHREGYIWRLFIFDDVAYVQPYLYSKDNSSQAPVLKLCASITRVNGAERNNNSLYKAFDEYFEQKWIEYTPRSTRLSELIPVDAATAVATIAKYHQFFVFVVPERYLFQARGEVPFHAIGGKLKPNEGWIEALEREVREEVGVGISIERSAHTRYLTSGPEIEPIQVEDEPRPYCVYKRTRDTDPNFSQPDVLWLVGYKSRLRATKFLKPRAEAAALLYLTGDALLRCVHQQVSFRQISGLGDGSRVIVREGCDFDLDQRALPVGLALIAGTTQLPRVLQRL